MLNRIIKFSLNNKLLVLLAVVLVTVGGIYLVLKLIDAAANYYMASIGHIMGTKIETEMRKDFFRSSSEITIFIL